MKKQLITSLLLSVFILASPAPAKLIQKRTVDEADAWLDGTITTLVVRETPISDAIRLLPCSIRFENVDDLGKKTVTANLYDVSLRQSLDAVTGQAGLGYKTEGKGLVTICAYKDLSYRLPATPLSETYSAAMGDMASGDGSSGSGSTGGVDSAGSATSGSGSSSASGGSSLGGVSMSLSHSSNVELWDTLKRNLESLVSGPGNSGKVIVDSRSSMVFVRCPAPMAAAVDEYMQALLDALMVSVQVEITLVDVTARDNREVGLDWNVLLDQMSFDSSISVVATGASSFFLEPTGAPFTFNFSRDHGSATQTAVLKLLRDHANIKVVERTTLSLRNNTAATIRRGTNIPFIDSITTTLSSDTSQTSVEKSSILSGIDIGVMANVYDDFVSLSLTPKVCDLLSIEAIEAGDTTIQNPQTQVRENLIQVLLKNNQTAMIVGAKNDRQGYEGQGVPGLSRLPVIGALFGDKAVYNENSHVVILVTPYILRQNAV